jgi:SSS family solute:Na+ symporter
MQLWGLHAIDLALIVVYVLAMIWVGQRVSAGAKDLDGFFLADRKLGRFYQFFLNFGCSTNADQAVAVSREVYRQGIGGMWIQFLVLFLTPFYWFTTLFFRRVRVTTIGDFFAERFDSLFLSAAYAVFSLTVSALIGGGVGYMVAGKTLVAMTPKPAEHYSVEERASVAGFEELQRLEARGPASLPLSERARFEELREKGKRGELKSFVSYVDPLWFYLVYAVVVGAYTIAGGFRAAAVTDAIQGVLILIFSIMLVPVGLARIGGFSGLHASVPPHMFALFGSATMTDYAWYTVLGMVLANLVSIIAVATGMQTSGSATNELAARVGMIGGMFTKRVLMLFWALAGLLAAGIYAGRLHDPDLIWGFMTRDLLWPGAIGLMLVGVLAANMSTLDASAVSHSALFIRNLYRPWRPGRTDAHYLFVGRVAIALLLAGGIGVALMMSNLLELYQYIISIPAIFGAPIWLGFIWRRLTKWAVILQVALCIVIYVIVPNLFPNVDAIARNPAFLAETEARVVTVSAPATADDVAAGRARIAGEALERPQAILPVGIYFERVARVDPADPSSPRIGLGRFHAELWVLSWFGLDFAHANKAQLVAARFFFDALVPFVLLFAFSFVTPRVPQGALDRFFAKLHTPVQPTPETEAAALAESYRNPRRFEGEKIVPGSSWEILKPGRQDYLGFGGSWLLVGVVILLLWAMVSIR